MSTEATRSARRFGRIITPGCAAIVIAIGCGSGRGGDATTAAAGGHGGHGGAGGQSSSEEQASSSSIGGGGVGGGGAGPGGHGGGGAPPDPCLTAHPTCPNDPPAHAGAGLVPIDRCNFPLDDDDTWTSLATIFDGTGLPKVTVADVLGDLNRAASPASAAEVPGSIASFERGFSWQSGDESVAYWVPQGLTGSADANAAGTIAGKKVLLTTWYYDRASDPGSPFEKGVRVALVDASDPAAIRYRFLLLVVPEAGNPATFSAVAKVHAGGVAWFDHYLYLVDTTHGFRVFDLDDIRKVDASKDAIGYDPSDGSYHAHGYAYVVPQVGSYTTASACSPRFSFVSLDRTVTPPALLAGEYCVAGGACDTLDGRLYRYPIDPATSRLAPGRSFPIAAFYAGETQVQGALSQGGTYYLSSSAPPNGGGALYVLPNGGPSTAHAWVNAPEDLLFDRAANQLFGLSEATDARYVFSVDAAAY